MRFTEEGETVNIGILNDEDLWYLSLILKPDDHLISEVLRRVERKDDVTRPKKTEREKVKVNLKIESIEFLEFSNRVHILGQIEGWPEDLIGEHQSVNIERDSSLQVVPRDLKVFMENLKESTSLNTSAIPVLSTDDQNISLYKITESGNELMWRIQTGRGKMFDSKDERYMDEFIRGIEPYRGTEIYVIGPSIFRDSLSKTMTQNKLSPINTQVSGSEEEGIRELLQEGIINLRRSLESKFVSQFLKGVNSGMSSYGIKQVEAALDIRAVSVLLVSDKFFRERESQKFMEKCSQGGCRVFVVHGNWETGKMVQSYGGLVALLRYRIERGLSAGK